MAAAPQLRVRDLGGAYHAVRLVPGASEISVKEAIAGAVGLAVGSYFLRNVCGTTVMDSTLTGDWTAVLLPGPLATLGACLSPLAS